MNWARLAALAAGVAALCWIVASVGLEAIVQDVALAGGAIPAAIGVHAVQLWFSGLSWRMSSGAGRIGTLTFVRIRWIREGVNTLLPAAQIGGQVVGVRQLAQAGVAPALAVASTILDLALEAVSQLFVVMLAMGVLLLLRDGDRAWVAWVTAGLGATAVGVVGMIVALRLGVLRLVETGLRRAVARWPSGAGWSMEGLHATLMARQADSWAMGRALALHSVSWALGAFEVWVILHALGHGVGLGPAFVIESLAMAARSAGFVVPGAVGVQEGGFVLVCGLFGVGPEPALALSVLKRLRELLVGGGALAVWQWSAPPGRISERV